MGLHGTAGVRALGLSPRFKHAGRLVLLVGVLLLSVGLFAGAASATSMKASSSHHQPTLTPKRATFDIPANNPPHRVWVLSLWHILGPKQHLLGEASGTSGQLVVRVPSEPGCDFQVDVIMHNKFYSGFQRQLTNCGRTVPTTTTTKPIATTTTKPDGTTTTTKPKTTGSTGGSTGSTTQGTGGGSSTTSTTTVPPSQLAFTGAGLGMWLTAALGALLILAGGVMLLYASRYTRTS